MNFLWMELTEGGWFSWFESCKNCCALKSNCKLDENFNALTRWDSVSLNLLQLRMMKGGGGGGGKGSWGGIKVPPLG